MKKRLTIEQIRNLTLQMNPELSEDQQATLYRIQVTGVKRKNDKNELVNVYVLKSKPSDESAAAGVKPANYIRAVVYKHVTNTQVDGVEGYVAKGKPTPNNFFENVDKDMFLFFKKHLKERNIEELGDDASGNPVCLLNVGIMGKIVALNVPSYVPHTFDGTKFVKLAGNRRDSYTGALQTNVEVVMTTLSFFADKAVLQSKAQLLQRAINLIQSRVLPFVEEAVEVIETKTVAGVAVETTKTVKEKDAGEEFETVESISVGETPADE